MLFKQRLTATAVVCLSLSVPAAAQNGRQTAAGRSNLNQIMSVMKLHAFHSALWQHCAGFIPSTVQQLGVKSVDLADLLKLMDRRAAVEYFDDQLGLARIEVSQSQCRKSDLERAAAKATSSHSVFYRSAVVPRIAEIEAEMKRTQRELIEDLARKRH